jgi:hypothetical protein
VVDCAEPDGKRTEQIKGELKSFLPSPFKCFANGSQEKGIHQHDSDSVNQVTQQALPVKSKGKVAERESARARESDSKEIRESHTASRADQRGWGVGGGKPSLQLQRLPVQTSSSQRLECRETVT